MQPDATVYQVGSFQPRVERTRSQIREDHIMERIRSGDHTVWKPDPADIVNRLGWVTSPEDMVPAITEIRSVVTQLQADGFTHALLMGMGGSSLAPMVFRHTFGVKTGYLDLDVIDSTDPRTVADFARRLPPRRTAYIVATKSGGTVETLSFFKYFYNETIQKTGPENAGSHFIAITDPGSRLEALGKALHFRKIFLNNPDIGGRYSALSYFGLVPAALVGMDLEKLLDRAGRMAAPDRDAGSRLGAVIGELARSGRDKLTLILSPPISRFGAWIEQLIAESTGKEGKGILPVDGEKLLSPDAYSDDRLFVYIRLKGDSTHNEKFQAFRRAGHPVVEIELTDLYDLGGEFFRWEMATAVAGHLLGINPFDQPNVESAKVSARQMLAAYQKDGKLPQPAPTLCDGTLAVYTDTPADTAGAALAHFLAPLAAAAGQTAVNPRPYVAIQAYLQPTRKTDAALAQLRTRIQTRTRCATTVGYGPRFLHSTGQLHKGDGGHGRFIQITDTPAEDIDIPDAPGESTSTITFGTLLAAQALGDRQALRDGGRAVIRLDLGTETGNGLQKIIMETIG